MRVSPMAKQARRHRCAVKQHVDRRRVVILGPGQAPHKPATSGTDRSRDRAARREIGDPLGHAPHQPRGRARWTTLAIHRPEPSGPLRERTLTR